ncbi:zinc-binding alcohol dehydrogenase family protein [Shinella sp. 838]|jgi:NADPH2:quinone reductase|uniref:zinc-binding alcohol dehydrogenase family protein n=1 Tax=unclassified Shinella TaxID=2643062 RepID=UPI0003C557F9|nr:MULTISPECIES: zinc-binding alcohol dehydrogenase family protein [unclassified Shinella]EYR81205.1 zinc-type alcohol dehydrogenase-like protein [Shinella sp. DD12]MCA0338442.1 zinc-binding alcohol dehydrogenase family protein [Pseudomonadota bacterium]MDG4671390.1 zinc-binding alcohol dehydrogenase family protein [Shinella sp. 838]
MRAIAYQTSQEITSETALVDIEQPVPEPKGRDLLVEIKAVSVNPVDTKLRRNAAPAGGAWRVLGFDAAGIVRAVGPEVTLFKAGDAVFYAGAIDRPGTNSEFHLVDERIVGSKPASLDFAATAALPLTAITAWEMLFDRLKVRDAVPGAANAILIIGGAGGVGSIAVQLARTLTDLTVIATASRPETADWVKSLGAHHIVDHSKPLAAEVAALGIGAPAFIFSTTNSVDHLAEIAEAIAPQGRFGLIDDPKALDVLPLKRKSVSTHWEMMFTRSLLQTSDMIEQHELLNAVARLVDDGKIRTTLAEVVGPINAENLRKAHAMIESGRTRGKLVLDGF